MCCRGPMLVCSITIVLSCSGRVGFERREAGHGCVENCGDTLVEGDAQRAGDERANSGDAAPVTLQLRWVGPTRAAVDVCTRFTLDVVDGNGAVRPVDRTVTVSVSTNGSALLFADASCAAAIPSFELTSGGTGGAVYLRDSVIEDVTLHAGEATSYLSAADRVCSIVDATSSGGAFDGSFDADGRLTVVSTNSTAGYATAVARHQDGRLVLAGYAVVGGQKDTLVLRLNADGSPDTTFSNSGFWTKDFGVGADDEPTREILAMDDGRILLVGGTAGDVFLARLTQVGDLDPTFHSTGIVWLEGTEEEWATGVCLDGSGRILIAGWIKDSATGTDAFVRRYLDDGTIDTTFASGMFRSDLGGGGDADFIGGVLVDTSGRVLAAGTRQQSQAAGWEALVARLTTTGVLDSSFGNGGIATLSSPDEYGGVEDVALQPDGRIVVARLGECASGWCVLASRLSAGGDTDGTFGTAGTIALRSGETFPYAIAVDGLGRIVIGGGTDNVEWQAFVLRLQQDGQPDATFGTDGFRLLSPDLFWIEAALLVQPDLHIVAAGENGNQFTVVRLAP